MNHKATYLNPVVIAMRNTQDGAYPGHIRIRNVGPDSFEYKYEEWMYQDGLKYNEETLAYLVVEVGTHTLQNGEIMQVQSLSAINDVWSLVQYDRYSTIPALFAQSQTVNDAQPIVTRIDQVKCSTAAVRMQEEQSETDGIHAIEDIGVITIGTV